MLRIGLWGIFYQRTFERSTRRIGLGILSFVFKIEARII